MTDMVKIAYNACFGGFGLSEEAVRLGRKLSGNPEWANATLKGEKWPDNGKVNTFEYSWGSDLDRADPILIKVIETLGDKANGQCAELAIAELPKGTQYRIEEYDGREWVATRDTYEWNTA